MDSLQVQVIDSLLKLILLLYGLYSLLSNTFFSCALLSSSRRVFSWRSADGWYILAGSHGAGAGSRGAWLIKTDTNGNEQWNLTFGGKFNTYSVAQTADGGYMLAGDAFLSGADDRVAWLIKVSGNNRSNETTETKVSPVKKAGGFEVVLAITILLAVYTAIWKRR